MAERIIKSIKQLPEWFKLENYSKARDFTPDNWYDELMPRLYLRYCVETYGKGPLDIPFDANQN